MFRTLLRISAIVVRFDGQRTFVGGSVSSTVWKACGEGREEDSVLDEALASLRDVPAVPRVVGRVVCRDSGVGVGRNDARCERCSGKFHALFLPLPGAGVPVRLGIVLPSRNEATPRRPLLLGDGVGDTARLAEELLVLAAPRTLSLPFR